MKILKYIISLSIIFSSCNNQELKKQSKFDLNNLKAEKYYDDGAVMFKSVAIGDTLIEEISYVHKFAIQYDNDGNKEKEGRYLNYSPIGYHKFYKNDKLVAVRHYLYLSNDSV